MVRGLRNRARANCAMADLDFAVYVVTKKQIMTWERFLLGRELSLTARLRMQVWTGHGRVSTQVMV